MNCYSWVMELDLPENSDDVENESDDVVLENLIVQKIKDYLEPGIEWN